MRRSVLLAVWLGLALSLLKEASTVNETDPDPVPGKPTSTPPEGGTGNETDPDPAPGKPTSKPPEGGTGNETDPDPAPGKPTSTPPEGGTGNETDPDPAPGKPTSKPPEGGTGNETDPDPGPGKPTSTPPEGGTGNETDPDPAPGKPTSKPPEGGTGNETDPDPAPGKPTSTPPEGGTGNETDPDPAPGKPTSTPPETDTEPSDNTTAPTSTPTEGSPGNETSPEPTSEIPTSTPPEGNPGNVTDPDPAPGKPTSTPPGDFCDEYPCGRNLATCISLNSSYTCECPYGFYYSNTNCFRGKVFPATITVNSPYSENLDTVNSMEYEQLFNNLSAFFESALKDLTSYRETVIGQIRSQTASSRSVLLNVTVANLFTFNTTESDASVDAAVQNAISQNKAYVVSYDVAKQCDIYQCDTNTTVCVENNTQTLFPECKCKPGLEKAEWDDHSCSACSKSCSAEAHKYCVREEGGPVCKCMTNFKEKDGKCVACPVGFSGEKCSDYSELILIIVGTVFGAIILSLVIAVSVISVRAKHNRNPEKRSLIKSGYSDMNSSDDRPSLFPRVQTTSGHANPGYQPNNPYEMRSTNRDGFPERDYDDMYEVSREPRGFRTQNRY